jgi:hypothetical protein
MNPQKGCSTSVGFFFAKIAAASSGSLTAIGQN